MLKPSKKIKRSGYKRIQKYNFYLTRKYSKNQLSRWFLVINPLKSTLHSFEISLSTPGPGRMSGRNMEVHRMSWYSNNDMLISIQDAADRVCAEYGSNVAQSVFQRFGVNSAEELDPSDYEAAFSDLCLIASDN